MISQSLQDLGWSNFFLSQLEADELGAATPARITSIHRSRADAITEDGPLSLTLPPGMPMSEMAVGDWVLFDQARVTRILDRKSQLARRAAGHTTERQLIAANLDTLAIVTSCNADFNLNRIERYLALARSSGVAPIVVLTKSDLADPSDFIQEIQTLDATIPVIALDGREAEAAAQLGPWCGHGQTLGLLGSSGVGKTTLANSLTGGGLATGGIREDDGKGRHTTTSRQLLRLQTGGWLLDSPGMRELQMIDAAEGIAESFGDLSDLAAGCRFSNCQHETEPGCAVRAAIASGALEQARFERWQKLDREDKFNTRSIAEAHVRARTFNKMARKAVQAKKIRRGELPLD